jgi:hypothetical protein
MSRIYVASSWRNGWQPFVVGILRDAGHDVYDFKNPRPGDNGFHWSAIDPEWKSWEPEEYRAALRHHPLALAGFNSDMHALSECQACVLVQPCGTSAHLELGWAAGAGKQTAILFPMDIGPSWFESAPPQEPELMAKIADDILLTKQELLLWAAIPVRR